MNVVRIALMGALYLAGSIQISLKKSRRPRISTGVQNSITAGIARRIEAPVEDVCAMSRNT